MKRLIASLACLFFAFGSVSMAWLAQGIIDGSIYVTPGSIGPYGLDNREFMLAVAFTLTAQCFICFAACGLIASDGRNKQCN
jgi:hypothetical protein